MRPDDYSSGRIINGFDLRQRFGGGNPAGDEQQSSAAPVAELLIEVTDRQIF
jgi:hypothetical protein